MKAILRKDKCLAAIGERSAEVTDDSKWDEMDGNAIANLHLALADGVLSSIEEKKSAKDIWDHLARLYEARSLYNKIFLKRKLYALRMTESTSVTEHVNNLNTLFSQLTSLSCIIEPQERAEILLQSLPDSYDQGGQANQFKTGEGFGGDEREVNGTGSSGSHNHGQSKTGKKKNFKCFKCGKPGHFRKDCRGLNTSYPQGNVASNSEDDNALCCEAAVANESRKRFTDVWLFDTGTTFHMTARREWFLQYKPISGGGSVYSCNDHELKIIGIGSIMVKMHDGTVRTIQNVRHVEGLKKNLLSLGQLDNLGCKVEIQNKIMKITKGALVLMKGEKVKIGHMSEQGMKILVERKLIPGLTKVSLPFCEYCVISKQHRLKFKTSNSRSVYVLELVHSDVWQAPVQSLGGSEYFNRVAEWMNITLLERARAVLATASLGKSFWVEAVNTACYMINRSPSTAVELKTPMEMWTGKPVNYSDLYIFGRYADGVKGYRLWDPTNHKVVFSRDVVFMEDKFEENKEGDSTTKETTSIQMENEFQSNDSSEAVPQHEVNETTESQAPTTRTSDRERKRPVWQSDYVMESNVAYCLLTEEGEPSTLQEALNNPDASFWKEAMQEEIEALHKNKTWELVPLPGGRKPIGNKWVYKIKRNGDDQVERYRARLVVKGYAQKEGIDFNEIFSPVVRMTTIRVVLAMCATYDLHLEQLDVKTAFLHGNLEEEIYMLQPEGFKQKGKENLVCRLNKSLYGLKQAPRCWYKRFDSFIRSLEYNRLHADPCAYFKREFEMKDLGPANKILGMQIHRDRVSRKIWLSQKSYVKKILQRFNMQDCKPISTPFPTDVKLSSKMSPSSEKERMEMSRVPYASAVGSLMFAMICTRPDIAHAVGVVSRYMAEPGREHWEAVKRILRYIKGTSDVALCFGDSDLIVTGYVDSDYAGDLDGSKSTTGYVFTLSGGTVSWVSKLQSVVAMSTTEAEYVAAAQASKEAVWLKMLLEELGHKQEKITLFCDNQSALYLARNPAFHSKTKHIRVQYHFIREKVEEGTVDMQKIHTDDNVADYQTKAINVQSRLDDCCRRHLEEANRRRHREDRQTSSRQVEALVVTRGRSMELAPVGVTIMVNLKQERRRILHASNVASLYLHGSELLGDPIKTESTDMIMKSFKVFTKRGLELDSGKKDQLMLNTTAGDVDRRNTCFLAGTLSQSKRGTSLWDPTNHKVVFSRDVVFMEDKFEENKEGDSTTRETTSIQIEKEFQSNDSSEAVLQHEVNETDESQAPATCTLNHERRRLVWQADYVWSGTIAYYAMPEDIEAPKTLIQHTNWELVPTTMSLVYFDDDVVLQAPQRSGINKLKAQLAREFEMKDLGPENKILGMKIHLDRVSRKIWLSQQSYVKKILQRYIKGTSDVAICFGDSDLIVTRYVDSDYAGDLDGSKSTTGYVFTLYGRTISCVSKLQSVVAMPTTEAEYVAAAQASKEAVWLKMCLERTGSQTIENYS
ncbi:retrovirus-related pol polyprotein from transposon TNT 1-94 [Tanacetum coccineum]